MNELSSYAFSPLREGDIALYRGSGNGLAPILLAAAADGESHAHAENADRLFNAFFTTKPHGTGMGLRISRSIIESHDGRLWAGDNSPRGASFYASLPTKVETRE